MNLTAWYVTGYNTHVCYESLLTRWGIYQCLFTYMLTVVYPYACTYICSPLQQTVLALYILQLASQVTCSSIYK